MKFLRRLAPLQVLLAAACALSAQAQTWPAKPITMVSPYAPGGPVDVVGRPLAKKMGEALGQPIVIENIGGGGTLIGTERVARAAPDGYTLLIGPVTSMAIAPHAYGKLRYKPEQFVPVGMMASLAFVLVVNNGFPARDLKEFIAYAKAHPGEVHHGTGGLGTTTHLLGEILNAAAGIKVVDVPYKGSAPILNDVLGGQIPAMLLAVNTGVEFVKSGKLRPLAVNSRSRLSSMPDVPTFAELGYPEMNREFWFGLFAPAGTPQPVVDKLNTTMVDAMRSDDIRKPLIAAGMTPAEGTPAQLEAVMQSDSAAWGKVLKSLNLKLD